MLRKLIKDKKLIIFDCDGTLLNSMPMWDHVGTDYILSQGITPPEDMEQKLISKTLEQSGEYYIQELGLKKTVEEYLQDIYAFVDRKYRYELELKPGAKEFVRQAVFAGKKVCILTTTGRPCVEAAMRHHGLYEMIPRIFTCGELGMSKTKPDIYRYVAEQMGEEPESTLVFEDAPFAIQNAKEAGCSVVSVYDRSAESGEEIISRYADCRIRNFEEGIISFMDEKKKVSKENMRLYAVTDRTWLRGRSLAEVVEEALQGGVTFLQLREKTLSEEEFRKEAETLKELTAIYHVPFVINDNVEIAKAVDADGVHVGQSDMELREARRILGPDKIIGVSAHNVEEAVRAEQNGADYLGVGAFHDTSTKRDTHVVAKETYQAIREAVSIPIVAIGGISSENISELEGYGVDGAAVVSAIFASGDIGKTCGELLARIRKIVV